MKTVESALTWKQ